MDDLLFHLLDLAFGLIGNFWPVILAYLGYKLFGGLGKKMSQGQPKRKPVRRMAAGPVLTPVEGGGYPRRVERENRSRCRSVSSPFRRLTSVVCTRRPSLPIFRSMRLLTIPGLRRTRIP
jgi:hypothetical protein